jgi:hypothetical protein
MKKGETESNLGCMPVSLFYIGTLKKRKCTTMHTGTDFLRLTVAFSTPVVLVRIRDA